MASATGWSLRTGMDAPREFVAYLEPSTSIEPLSLHVWSEWRPRDAEAFLTGRLSRGRVLTPQERGSWRTIHDPETLREWKFKLCRDPGAGWLWQLDGKTYRPPDAAEFLLAKLIGARSRA
jgi:hypothetical protein